MNKPISIVPQVAHNFQSAKKHSSRLKNTQQNTLRPGSSMLKAERENKKQKSEYQQKKKKERQGKSRRRKFDARA